MNTLPPEIATLICKEIRPADVPRLRLASRFWNEIASPYILHEPLLRFTEDSFNRLLDLSRHDYFRKLVTGLVYEPNTLEECDRKSWEKSIPMIDYVHTDDLGLPPDPDATERDRRVYHRNVAKTTIRRKPYSKDQLDAAWSTYERFLCEQDKLMEKGYGIAELTEALKKFPCLRNVSINYGWGLWHGKGYSTDKKFNPYAEALASAGSDYLNGGIPQIRSLLQAIHKVQIQLNSLRIGDVSWRFLEEVEGEELEKMKQVIAPLKQFELHMSTGYDEENDDIGCDILECWDFFVWNRSLHDLLAAASNVEDLCIGFDCSDPYAPAEINYIFGSKTWPFLHTLSIECIEISAKEWLAFIERHSSTLKSLTLCSLELFRGEWVDVLERMQQSLSLKYVYLGSQLTGLHPQQFWNLAPGSRASSRDMCSQGNRTQKALEDFFYHGGDCPLRDMEAHPNEFLGSGCI